MDALLEVDRHDAILFDMRASIDDLVSSLVHCASPVVSLRHLAEHIFGTRTFHTSRAKARVETCIFFGQHVSPTAAALAAAHSAAVV